LSSVFLLILATRFTPPNGSDTLPTTASVISRAQKRGYTHADLRPGRGSNATVMTYGVPYSEHSSFFELTCFALSLDWDRIIATVNLGERSRAKMDRWFSKWATERRKGSRDIIPHRRPDYW
jgi:DNA cross-link repair 1A protein